MVRKVVLFIIFLTLLVISSGCSNSSAPSDEVELTISAAASLTDALDELKASFEQEHSKVRITYIFGGSGKLAMQIENGAPSDVFLSASQKDMDQLEAKNLILAETRVDFARNELVLITNKDSSIELSSFEEINSASIAHIAIGEPQSVPVGRYTKEVLERLSLWEALQGRIVFASDVRQVLTYVESGNADVGVVYASDAMNSDKVKVLAAARSEWHEPIVYPGAITTDAAHPDVARLFMEYLTSAPGKYILNKYGFN